VACATGTSYRSERLEHALGAFGLALLAGERGSRGAIDGLEDQNVQRAQSRDRAVDHRLGAEPLADLAGEVGGQALVRRPSHERQRLADAVVRDDVEERRLAELYRERVRQRRVEHRLGGLVLEAGEQDLVPLADRPRPRPRHEDPDEDRAQEGEAEGRPPHPPAGGRRRARGGAPGGRGRRGGPRSRCDHVPHPGELEEQLGGVLMPVFGTLGEKPAEHRLELGRDPRIDPPGPPRLAVQDPVEHDARRGARECSFAGRHLVEHGTEREQV